MDEEKKECDGCGNVRLIVRSGDGLQLCRSCRNDRIPDRRFGALMSSERSVGTGCSASHQTRARPGPVRFPPSVGLAQALEFMNAKMG